MSNSKEKNLTRFLLTFFLGWIGSIIINNTDLKPNGYKSRTLAYFFLSVITSGIYGLVASIANLSFDPAKPSNIGYAKEEGYVYTSNTTSTPSQEAIVTSQTQQKVVSLTLKEKLQKLIVLYMAIMSFVCLFFPLDYNNVNSFAFFTNRYGECNFFFTHFFTYVILLSSIVSIVLAVLHLKNKNFNDKIIIIISLATAVLNFIVLLSYRDTYFKERYRELQYLYPQALIIQILLFIGYIVVGKLFQKQPQKQTTEATTIPQKNELTLEKIELLKQFSELKDSGIITVEEFENKKKDILE